MKNPTLGTGLFFFLLLFPFSNILTQTQIGGDINGDAAGDQSGSALSISTDGTRIAIGAKDNDGNGSNSGHVKIFEESGGTWSQVGANINGEAAGDQAGFSVAISADGTRVAIGARGNSGNGVLSGHVRIFEESGGTWSQVGSDIDGEAAGDQAGYSVAISSSGTRVAIGALANDGNGADSGHVRIFEESGGTWSQVGSDIDGEAASDRSSRSVSMSADGTRVAISSITNSGNGANSGHVRIFEESGGTWSQVGSDIDGEAAGDMSGYSVSISADGTRVASSAPFNAGNGTNSGHARVYKESGGVWTQVGSDIDGEAGFNFFGESMSLSANGGVIIISSVSNNYVKVYQEINNVWTQKGINIVSPNPGTNFGQVLSLSPDGKRTVISAIGNDDNGGNSGQTQTFDLSTILPVELISFSGKISDRKIHLSWSTASEINNRGFEIQRSPDGIDWKKLSFVPGNNTSSINQDYHFVDGVPLSGNNYYRLKQIDTDDQFAFSNVINIFFDGAEKENKIFPNPVTSELTLQLQRPCSIFEITDTSGKIVLKGNCSEDGLETIDVSKLSKGTYLIFYQEGTSTQSHLFIKE